MNLEDEFASQLDKAGYYYERQYKAIPDRRFLYDFYIPLSQSQSGLLIEIQGGIYQYMPSHASASGIRRDAEKVNLAVLNGYKIFLFTSDMVDSGEALKFVDDMVHEISLSAL